MAYLLAMVLAGVLAHRGERIGLAVLVLLSFAWFKIDSLWEGKILWSFNSHQGLTAADLFGVAGLAFAAWVVVRDRRHRRR